jgi:tetratricopeptide (TPR) repeat protein
LADLRPQEGIFSRDVSLPRAVHVALKPLSEQAIAAMVRQLLKKSLRRELKERIVGHSRGNPLFAREMAMAHLRGDDRIPETMEDLIITRVDHLVKSNRPHLKQSLLNLTVIGDSFDYRLGAALEDEDHLLALAESGYLQREISEGRTVLRFDHNVTRMTLYNQMLLDDRESQHRRVAGAIEQTFSDRLSSFIGELAGHWRLAGAHRDAACRAKAVSYLAELANVLVNDGQREAACTEYEKLISQLDRNLTEENLRTNINLLIHAGQVFASTVQGERSACYYHLAYQRIGKLGVEYDNERVRVLGSLAESSLQRGDIDAALDYFAKAQALAVKLGRPNVLIRLNMLEARARAERFRKDRQAEDFEEGQRLLNLALSTLEKEKIPESSRLKGVIYNNLGDMFVIAGKPNEALKYFFKSLTIKEEHSNLVGIGLTIANIGEAMTLAHRFDEGVAWNERCLEIGRKTKNNIIMASALAHLTICRSALGRGASAREAERELKKLVRTDANVKHYWEIMKSRLVDLTASKKENN